MGRPCPRRTTTWRCRSPCSASPAKRSSRTWNELDELAQRLKSRLADLDGTPPEAPREEGEAGSAGAGAPAVDSAAPEESFSLSELSLNISALDESVIAGKSPLGAASFNDAPEDLDVSRASSAARRRLYNNDEIDRMARIMGSR